MASWAVVSPLAGAFCCGARGLVPLTTMRTFVVWPPVVHLQRDDDDTPTDGYGGNSSRFIEAYLGMDER